MLIDDSRGPTTPVLSPQQQSIVRLLAAGLSNRQIGEALVISDQTVKNHLTRVRAVLGLPGGPVAQRRLTVACVRWCDALDRGVPPTVLPALVGPGAEKEARVARLRRQIENATVRAGGSDQLARAILAWADQLAQRAERTAQGVAA